MPASRWTRSAAVSRADATPGSRRRSVARARTQSAEGGEPVSTKWRSTAWCSRRILTGSAACRAPVLAAGHAGSNAASTPSRIVAPVRSERRAQLRQRRDAGEPAVLVLIQPAGLAERLAGRRERVDSVDQQRRRAPHARGGRHAGVVDHMLLDVYVRTAGEYLGQPHPQRSRTRAAEDVQYAHS